jgi:hypothetical protein
MGALAKRYSELVKHSACRRKSASMEIRLAKSEELLAAERRNTGRIKERERTA